MPVDFPKWVRAGETVKSLMRRYGVSNHTILNWRKEVVGKTKKQPPTEREPLTGGR